MNRMFVRIHKKNGLFFFQNSNIYDAFTCGKCTKNKLYLLEECDQTKFFKQLSSVLFRTVSFMWHRVVQAIESEAELPCIHV